MLCRLLACSTVLYFVRFCVMGSRARTLLFMAAALDRASLVCSALLEKQRWHCCAVPRVSALRIAAMDILECAIVVVVVELRQAMVANGSRKASSSW